MRVSPLFADAGGGDFVDHFVQGEKPIPQRLYRSYPHGAVADFLSVPRRFHLPG